MKILLSLIKLENKLSLIQALKINTIWSVTRLQSKIYKRVTRNPVLFEGFEQVLFDKGKKELEVLYCKSSWQRNGWIKGYVGS